MACRICLEGDESAALISPCACKGSVEFVHQHLLSCARSSSGFLGANWFPASDAARLRLELRVEVVDLLLAQLPSAAPHEVRGSLEEQRGAAVQELRKPRGVPAPLPFVVRASHYCARSVPFDDA